VNADTAAAKSKIKTSGLLNRSIKAISKWLGLAASPVWSGRLKNRGGVRCPKTGLTGMEQLHKVAKWKPAKSAVSYIGHSRAGPRGTVFFAMDSGSFMSRANHESHVGELLGPNNEITRVRNNPEFHDNICDNRNH
jgi:hypothetical protein